MSEPAKVKVVWCQHHRDRLGYEAAGEIGRRGLQQQQPADHLDVLLATPPPALRSAGAAPDIGVAVVSVRKPVPVAAPRSGRGKEVRRLFQPSTQPTGHHLSTNGQRDKFECGCNLISSFFVVRAPPGPPFTALCAYAAHSGPRPPRPRWKL